MAPGQANRAGDVLKLSLLSRGSLIERTAQVFRNPEHGAVVVELTAVVWSREDGDQLLVSEELVTILHDLVTANYQLEVVLLQELLDYLLAKHVRSASIIRPPPLSLYARSELSWASGWIRPK